MASSEAIKIAGDVIGELENLRRNIRSNAELYAQQINAGGTDYAMMLMIMSQDNVQYGLRLYRIEQILNDMGKRGILIDGLTALSVGIADIEQLSGDLRTLIDDTSNGTFDNIEAILVRSTAVLTDLPAHLSLW